jgi:hypothetical protein
MSNYGLTFSRPTTCVTCWRVGRGNAQDQDSAEARKMLAVGGAESPASGACFVRRNDLMMRSESVVALRFFDLAIFYKFY